MSDVKKRPLILWSGGFDSTCLVINKLSEDDIDVLYVNLDNNIEMQRHEKKAIAKMKILIRNSDLKGKIINEHVFGYHTIIADKKLYALPALWLQAASIIADASQHSSVNIGYVRHDDAWHYKTEILNVYDALTQLTCPENIVPVKFPYEWHTKARLLEYLADFVYNKQILNLIHYCEENTKKPCGECSSCKHHNDELKGEDHRIMAVDMTAEFTKKKDYV